MNYSASEVYSRKCQEFEKKAIKRSKIRIRLFRNYYVLHQTSGSFTHKCFVFNARKGFDPETYAGDFYGPFLMADEAKLFGLLICDVHTSFLLG